MRFRVHSVVSYVGGRVWGVRFYGVNGLGETLIPGISFELYSPSKPDYVQGQYVTIDITKEELPHANPNHS